MLKIFTFLSTKKTKQKIVMHGEKFFKKIIENATKIRMKVNEDKTKLSYHYAFPHRMSPKCLHI